MDYVLSVGKYSVLLDQEGFSLAKKMRMRVTPSYQKVYVHCVPRGSSRKAKTKPFHRVLLNAPEGVMVDHINGDPLDNRLVNLRLVDAYGNAQNRKPKPGRLKGVERRGASCRAVIGCRGRYYKSKWFKTAKEAAKAYDEMAKELHGQYAGLNF